MSDAILLLLAVTVVVAAIDILKLTDRTADLRGRVDCLEHPWQASSTSASLSSAGLVVRMPATRTDCRHPR